MKTCPRCGARSDDYSTSCSSCGHGWYARRGVSTKRPGALGTKTIVGFLPDDNSKDLDSHDHHEHTRDRVGGDAASWNVSAGELGSVPIPKKTVLGVAPLAGVGQFVSPAQVDIEPQLVHAQGLASSLPQSIVDAEQASTEASPQASFSSPNASQASYKKTVFGVAPPPETSSAEALDDPPVVRRVPAHGAEVGVAPKEMTIVGVATPGVAPIKSSRRRRRVPQPTHRRGESIPAELSSGSGELGSGDSRPREMASSPSPSLYRRIPFIVAIMGVVTFVAVVCLVFLFPTASSLSAKVVVDGSGRDVLRLGCESCPDGTLVSVGGITGRVASKEVAIVLTEPMVVGENHFLVSIDRGSSGRRENVELTVPLMFRVSTDLSGLGGAVPTFHVVVDALSGTSMEIDGVPFELSDGRGRYAVDVSALCTGSSSETVRIERTVSYTIHPYGGSLENGSVHVSVGVVPLALYSPRPHVVVESEYFLVAGRAARGAVLEAQGERFGSDDDGSFSRRMLVKRYGEFPVSVRAMMDGLVPRTVSFVVKRVESLEDEGKTFAKRVALGAGELMRDARFHVGEEVVLRGEVLDARSQTGVQVVLLDASGACSAPPCKVRVVYASADPVAKGVSLRVFGHVAAAEVSAGVVVPEIDADFVLVGR